MSRKYKFFEKSELYFVTYAVVYWIDVFTRDLYREVLIDSWKYCMNNKGLRIYAWCIMTNHVHMFISSNKNEISGIMRDMKSFTSTTLKKAIINNPQESRKEWMLRLMKQAGTLNKNNKGFQFWQQHNHPILLDSNKLIDQKLDYLPSWQAGIHNNPVSAGFVDEPEDYIYSSARDYAGQKGNVEVELLF
jgi:REP element-mobilizing transposase RayT